jgi:Tfp pilus tip-associated adhesin PilY1
MLHSFEAGAYRPYYVDTTVFGTSDSCTSTTIDTFKSAINANGEIYPSPGGDIISKRGYYEWSGGAPNYGDGKEIFAFIPINLIAQLKNNALDELDQAYVDASPSVAHVRFVDGTWHTIVITAEGNGGDSVFALDVTDPDNPKYLWEFTDPDLMRSRSSPSIGVVFRLQKASGPVWAVAFVSGINNDSTKYPSIYIVNAETGELDQRVYLDSATDGAGGTPSGQPAALDSDGNGYVDRLYIGTDTGYMYKINIPDSGSSSSTTVCTFYDAGQPIYASPAVTVKNTVNSAGEIDYRAIVLFGTGDSPYQTDATSSQYYFYAIEDKDNKNSCNAGSQLWNMALPAGHRVFASAAATAGRVYFGTTTAVTEDPFAVPVAAAGGAYGNFYAMDVETGAEVFSQAVGNVTTTPVVNDEHVYIKTSDGKMSGFGGETFQNEVPKGGSSQAKVSIWREIN